VTIRKQPQVRGCLDVPSGTSVCIEQTLRWKLFERENVGPKGEDRTRRRTLYSEGFIIWRMKWVGHAERVEEMRRVLKIEVGNPERKTTLGFHRRRRIS
jgi:hypothetical protein